MWFPLRANVVVFRSLKQALFEAVAASAEPRRQKKTKIAQGPASQHSTALRQNRRFHLFWPVFVQLLPQQSKQHA
jgi:hypothetical protein